MDRDRLHKISAQSKAYTAVINQCLALNFTFAFVVGEALVPLIKRSIDGLIGRLTLGRSGGVHTISFCSFIDGGQVNL